MYIFCEDRTRPITSREEISYLKRNNHQFSGVAQPGEIYTFQICISSEVVLTEVSLIFENLIHEKSDCFISVDQMTCYNLEGIDDVGHRFRKKISVKDYQVLWVGVKLPKEIERGVYTSQITVLEEQKEIGVIDLRLDVQGEVLVHEGYNDTWRLSRLEWLNSTIAQDNKLVKGFNPIQVEDKIVKIMGRHIHVGDEGMIDNIESYFEEDNASIGDKAFKILRQPMTFTCYIDQEAQKLEKKCSTEVIESTPEKVIFESTQEGTYLEISHQLTLEYDGYIALKTKVKARKKCVLSNIVLDIPFTKEVSKYSMGFGHEGGYFKPFDYKWNDEHQDSLWVGNVNAGLVCVFKDENYERPFVNVYYNQRKRIKPTWCNADKGQIQLLMEEEQWTLSVNTGDMAMEKGQTETYISEFYVTPFKCIDYKKHWSTRYYHPHENSEQRDWLKEMDEEKCNYMNIHHGQELHPFINYPFVEKEKLKSFVKRAHEKGKKVKLYYTLRELTNHCQELWALFSLGDEIFPRKSDKDLIPAWEHVFRHGKYKGEICASILVNPSSRLNNFYLEGLEWLVKDIDIDGIYIDDVAYDRKTIQRVRKILDQKEGSLIDLHSWNHMNEHAGMVNCALLYKELLPYVDSLWFGEGFDYDKSPDYWLAEMTGIPFGLMGEMLQNDGHPFRGMVFGMTNRSQWGERNPKSMHDLWDEFGIEDSKMKGYWCDDCPVKVNHEKIKATAYVKDTGVLIALGSWSDYDEVIKLIINWKEIGIKEEDATCRKVSIHGLQQQEEISISNLKVEASLGAIIEISRNRKKLNCRKNLL